MTASYDNASQSVFQDIAGSFGPAVIAISVARTSNLVRLSWSANVLDVRLEQSPAMVPGDWAGVTNAVVLEGGQWNVEVQPADGQRFYRLRP